VKVIPEDFFDDEVSRENFLRPSFVSLLRNAREESQHLPSHLTEEVEKFSRAVTRRFRGLNLESAIQEEEMDEAPCVVPLEEVTRALGDFTIITTEDMTATAAEPKSRWPGTPMKQQSVMETVPEEAEQ